VEAPLPACGHPLPLRQAGGEGMDKVREWIPSGRRGRFGAIRLEPNSNSGRHCVQDASQVLSSVANIPSKVTSSTFIVRLHDSRSSSMEVSTVSPMAWCGMRSGRQYSEAVTSRWCAFGTDSGRRIVKEFSWRFGMLSIDAPGSPRY